jgi:hypothetical protein
MLQMLSTAWLMLYAHAARFIAELIIYQHQVILDTTSCYLCDVLHDL